jgi:hypothetical protein
VTEEELAELVGIGELGAHVVIGHEATQDRGPFGALGEGVAEPPCAGKRPLRLGSRVASDRHEQGCARDDEAELAGGAVRSVGRMGEHVERGGEVRDGLVRRMTLERPGPRELVVLERAPVVTTAREVHRELGRALAATGPEGRLLAEPDGAMQTDATRLRDPLVEDAPVEGVQEPIGARHRAVRPFGDSGVGDERAEGREPLADVLHRLRVVVRSGRDGGDRELVPGDARGLEDAAGGRRQRAQPPSDELLETGRNAVRGLLEGALHSPFAVALDQHSAGDEVVHHVDHEERVAVGPLVDPCGEPPHLAGGPCAEPRLDVRRDVSEREQLERDLVALPVRLQLLLDGVEGMVVYDRVGRPEAADHHETCRLAPPGETCEQVDGGTVAPLEVLEHDYEGMPACEHLERVGELAEHAGRSRCDRRTPARARSVVRLDRRQLRHPRGRVAPEDLAELGSAVVAHEPADRFEDRQIRLALPVLIEALAPRDAGAPLPLDAPDEAVDQGGLPDSGLAGHEDELSGAPEGLSEPPPERREVGLASDHLRPPAGRRETGSRPGASSFADESVAFAADGLDVAGRLGVVIERLSDCPHGNLQHRLGDVGPGPELGDELVAADHLAGSRGEVGQNGERTRLERNALVALAEHRPRRVEAISPEGDPAPRLTHDAPGNTSATGRVNHDRGTDRKTVARPIPETGRGATAIGGLAPDGPRRKGSRRWSPSSSTTFGASSRSSARP